MWFAPRDVGLLRHARALSNDETIVPPSLTASHIGSRIQQIQWRGETVGANWTLMETHGLVLFYIAAQPDATIRQIAEELGLTERRIAQIIHDLAEADMLTITKDGRRNRYSINLLAGFRHPTLSHVTLGKFVDVLQGKV